MGKIGRFIDAVCETHPQLMRAVLDRPLAPLGNWLQWDDSGQVCGCLIGTTALAAGFRAAGKAAPGGTPHNACSSIAFVSRVVGWSSDDVDEVGMRVFFVSARINGSRPHRNDWCETSDTSDARTVHLIRQRIARQLAIRESALPLGSRLPNEPVEVSPSPAGTPARGGA